jgi:hypothetical protein
MKHDTSFGVLTGNDTETSSFKAGDTIFRVRTSADPSGAVLVAVTDVGVGLPAGLLRNVSGDEHPKLDG